MLKLSNTFAALVAALPFVVAQSAVWGQVRRSTHDEASRVLTLSSSSSTYSVAVLVGVSLYGLVRE